MKTRMAMMKSNVINQIFSKALMVLKKRAKPARPVRINRIVIILFRGICQKVSRERAEGNVNTKVLKGQGFQRKFRRKCKRGEIKNPFKMKGFLSE
jgi:hypothetical protein